MSELKAARSSLSSLQAECESRRLEAEEREREHSSQLTSLQQEVVTKTQQLSSYQSQVGVCFYPPELPVALRYIVLPIRCFCIYTSLCVWQVSDLEGEVLRLTAQSHADECDGEQNGTVTVSDLDQLQKVNKDLEQQLAEKNKVRANKTTEMKEYNF